MSDPCFLSATSQAQLLNQGDISAAELLDIHLNRIDAVNPEINAIVTECRGLARNQALASDARRASGDTYSALDGLPIAIKDKFDVAGVRSTQGSPALADHVPEHDDLIVSRERAAGMVFLGKTNVPEFSFGGQTTNPVFGLTRNPYDHNVSTSGSSGGSASALAAGLTALANGSDIAGSLRAPAAWCNVVGFRPTPGRIPVTRGNNVWEEFSVHGPMARTVNDALLYMTAVAGPSDRAPISVHSQLGNTLDRSWRSARLAWSMDLATGDDAGITLDPAMRAVVERARPVFTQLGATIIDECPRGHAEVTRVLFNYKCLAALSRLGDLVDTKPDLVKPLIHDLIARARCFSADDVIKFDKTRTAIWHRTAAFFVNHDYLIWPVSPCNPVPLSDDDLPLDWGMLDLQALVGLPAISVPCGFSDDGHPVGVQITGKRGDDLGVIQLAHAFERETQYWKQRPPGM